MKPKQSKNQPWRWVLRVLGVLILIASIIWLIFEPGFEPLIGLLGAAAAVIGSFLERQSSEEPLDDRIGGDTITVDDIENSQGVAVGRESRASVVTGSYTERGDIYYHAGPSPDSPLTPAPRSLKSTPRPPEKLVGRDELCADITAELSKNWAVLLHGLGGMGKTAIAATLAAAASTGDYPGGVRWLTVLGKGLEELCDEVFQDEGQPDLMRLPAENKPAPARSLLGDHRLLIVLDDVDAGNPAAREWMRQVQPPNMPLLVTNRSLLPGLEAHAHPVDELSREDAKTLLCHHAGRAADRLTDELADRACDELGDHPLAIEVFASLLAAEPGDLQEMLDGLGPAHERVGRLMRPDAPEGSKDDNVYASLELSWERLNGDQKIMLARLAAFFAPSTGDELLALACGLDDAAYRAARSTLYTRSLIRRLSEQNAEHALVQAFVEAKRREEGEWNIDRHVAVHACVAFANRHNSTERAAHDLLDAERDNLLAAAQWAAAHDMHVEVNRLAFDLYGHSDFLDRRGYSKQALPLLTAGVEAAKVLDEKSDEGAHLTHLGHTYRNLGQVEQAIEIYGQALEIAREIGDRDGESANLSGLGVAYTALGQVEQAVEAHEQALEIARKIEDRRGEENALGNLGNMYRNLGLVEQAIETYEQALEIAREIGDRRGEGASLGNLGAAYGTVGQAEQAIEYYEQALIVRKEIGDRRGEGNDLGNLAIAYMILGQMGQAIDVYEQALSIKREVGDRHGEATDLFNLGLLLADHGHITKAIEHIEQARAIYTEVKDPYVEVCDEVLARLRGEVGLDNNGELDA